MTIDPADAARALDAVGDPGATALGTAADGALTLTLPSAGAAMVFAAALAADRVTAAIDDNEDVDRPDAAAAGVIGLMAAASTTWDGPPGPDGLPALTVTFPPGAAPPPAPEDPPARDLAGLALAWAAQALEYAQTPGGYPGFSRWAAGDDGDLLSSEQLLGAELLTRLLAARLLDVPAGELTCLAAAGVTAAHIRALADAAPAGCPVLARAPGGWAVETQAAAGAALHHVAAGGEQLTAWLDGMPGRTPGAPVTDEECALFAHAVNDALTKETRALTRAAGDAAAFAGQQARGFTVLARLLVSEPLRGDE